MCLPSYHQNLAEDFWSLGDLQTSFRNGELFYPFPKMYRELFTELAGIIIVELFMVINQELDN